MNKCKKEQIKRVVGWAVALCLSLIFILGFVYVFGRILEPKYTTESLEGNLIGEYYDDVGVVKHDVVFLGDCEVYESVIPPVMWDEYGISSIVRGSPQQLVWQSYFLLEDTLRYETPDTVVFNVLALKYGCPQNEAFNRMTLDGMRWSSAKAESIRASLTDDETFISYVFPLFRYHDRIGELTKDDFTYAFSDRPTVSFGGYLLQTEVKPMQDDGVSPDPLLDPELPSESMKWLDKMVELCESHNIRLILMKSPANSWHYWWYDEWDEQICAYAADRQLEYINMTSDETLADLGIDWTRDTYDGGVHLNVYGAEKVTRFFGNYLSQSGVPTRQSENSRTDEIWRARVKAYRDALNSGENIYLEE